MNCFDLGDVLCSVRISIDRLVTVFALSKLRFVVSHYTISTFSKVPHPDSGFKFETPDLQFEIQDL